ncbi:MAG TPA: UDP-3-O-acyl-N-acetylglucosamine deacetylase [Polyangiaceae bacterium]|nr:UDP-3-O-acyl-N-acetylglucosamine deacetylase [Polyangiaceae bacterium]
MGDARYVRLTGRGLHSGRHAEVKLSRIDGPLVFRTRRGAASLAELIVAGTDLGVSVRSDDVGLELESVEHFFAALGGLSIRSGIAVESEAREMPLLDGAALTFAAALASLGAPAERSTLRILRDGIVRIGASTYEFTTGERATLEVTAVFDAKKIGRQTAEWDGSPDAFLRNIAGARTFGFRRDEAVLRERGRALGVDPKSVMVLDDDGNVEAPGAPARYTEFARHKLLDLVGDLYLYGGPPLGRVRATRPGHGATRLAMDAALSQRIVGSSPSTSPSSPR